MKKNEITDPLTNLVFTNVVTLVKTRLVKARLVTIARDVLTNWSF